MFSILSGRLAICIHAHAWSIRTDPLAEMSVVDGLLKFDQTGPPCVQISCLPTLHLDLPASPPRLL